MVVKLDALHDYRTDANIITLFINCMQIKEIFTQLIITKPSFTYT